jgi:hypothetical protein
LHVRSIGENRHSRSHERPDALKRAGLFGVKDREIARRALSGQRTPDPRDERCHFRADQKVSPGEIDPSAHEALAGTPLPWASPGDHASAAEPLTEIGYQPVRGCPFLPERVAVAHGDGTILDRLAIDRDGERRAGLVLTAVPTAD